MENKGIAALFYMVNKDIIAPFYREKVTVTFFRQISLKSLKSPKSGICYISYISQFFVVFLS
jgi:hypothetical protein